jgi:cytoskeleton protein RodZ
MSEAEVAGGAAIGAAVPRPGQALAEARAARNLSVADVALQLKLSVSQIVALEADAYDKLPGPVFVRGFVRNYARLLELDADALADTVDLPQVSRPASAAVPQSRNIPFPERRPANWRPYALVLAMLISAVVLFELYFSAPPVVTVSAVSPQPVAAPAPVPQEQPKAPADPLPQPPLPAEPAAPAIAAAEPAVPPAPAVKAESAAELRFVFEIPSWVEVRDRNDRVLFSQLNPAGTEQQVQGRLPLSVVVGNARGVRLTYNGQPFDLAPHTRVEVARFTLE